MKQKILSIFTVLAMLISLFGAVPITASAEDITTISTLSELEAFRDSVNSGTNYEGETVTLTSDIDLSGSDSNQWTPIGTFDSDEFTGNAFSGTFNGNGHKITGLYVNEGNTSIGEYFGLFGYVGEAGTVKSLSVDGSITANGASAGIAARNAGNITDCKSSVTISTAGDAAGIVALNLGTITNCRNTGALTSKTNNFSTDSASYYRQGAVGGIVSQSMGTISKCYNTGAVKADVSAGGIVATSVTYSSGSSEIFDCYNTGTVTVSGTEGYLAAAGIAGMTMSCTLADCYNFGAVTITEGDTNVAAGIVAVSYGSDDISNCYYLTGTANGGIGADDTAGSAEVKTADEFKVQSTFTEWNFTGTWTMNQALSRPILTDNPESESHTHKICNDTECTDHEDITWSTWTSDNSMPATAGNYYLSGDVTISGKWDVPEGVTNLCLNGHTLQNTDTSDSGRVINVLSNRTLNLCDCSADKTGTITGNTPNGVAFANLVVGAESAPMFNMYGGTISGIDYTNSETYTGAAVSLTTDDAEFHMYGGKITNNGAVGVDVLSGKFFVSGTVDISNNGSSYAQMMSTISEQLEEAGIHLGNIGENIDISVQHGNTISFEAPVTMPNKSSVFMTASNEDMIFCGTFTQGWSEKMSGKNPTDYFTSTADAFEVKLNAGGEAELAEKIAHTHKVCAGADCTDPNHEADHKDITWTAWTSNTSLPTEAGNYYLTTDVISTTQFKPDGIKLCLNGHTVNYNAGDVQTTYIQTGCTFDLCDCGENGKLLSPEEAKDRNIVSNHGTFNMYGGTLSGKTSSGASGLGVSNAGTFNMYGGKITDTHTEYGTGGGVNNYEDSSVFNMYGGEISGNTANAGGAVSNLGQFNMTGGEIHDNTSLYGSGIMAHSGTAKISGGKIYGNKSTENIWCGGILAYGNNALELSGNPEIRDNTDKNGNPCNVYLVEDKTITVSGALWCEPIGISSEKAPTEGNPINITGTNDADYSQYFTSDNSTYTIQNTSENVLLFILKPVHTHNLTHYEAVDATCTTAGKGEYWKCEGEDGCNKMFSDANAATEIDKIPDGAAAKNHDYGKWELTLVETSTEVIRTCGNDSSHKEKKNAEIMLVLDEDNPIVYSSEEIKPKASVKVFESDGTEVTLTEDTDYTLSYENNINAGTATVKITGKGDYGGTVQRTFTIGAKTVKATAATAENRAYDGTKTVTVTGVTLDGVYGGDTAAVDTDNLKSTIENADAGDYTTVTLQNLTLKNNENRNYILKQANVTVPSTVKIEKADVPALKDGTPLNIANNLEKEYSYLLSRLCPQINEEGAAVQKNWGERSYEIAEIVFDEDGYYDDNTAHIGTAESGGTVNNTVYLPVKYKETTTTGKVGTVKIRVTSKNYKTFENKFEVHASNKNAVTFGGITAQNSVYNGNQQKGYTGELTITDSDNTPVTLTPEILYSGRLNTGYTEQTNAPINAGTYTVIFRVADTDENYIGKRAVNFEITRADGSGSVTMADFKFGEEPSVPVPQSDTNGTDHVTYEYKTQGADDSEYTSVKPTKAGNYTVKATFAQTTNYKAVTATADFTINHDYSDKWSHDATNHWRECSCGSRTDEAEHTWDKGTVTQTVTCTLEGRTRFACTVCGREKVETTSPIGHSWGKWTITVEPTLMTTGTAERICERNSEHKETITIPVLTNTTVWTAGTKVEPTENTDGSQEYTSEYGTVTITIPATGDNRKEDSEVVIKDGTPNVTVDGLDELAKEIEPSAKNVKITMTVESKSADSENIEQKSINNIAKEETIEYLDISLIKTVDTATSSITETAKTLKIVIPFDTTGKKNITVYRYHADNAEQLSDNAENDEYYVIGDKDITVYAKKFSTYAIGYDKETSEPTPKPTVKPHLGGSGTSSYKVTFKAGENGKITKGSASVNISRNTKIKDTQIPTITANEGYKFIGWSTDGKTTVEPMEEAVTKAITFTALYETVKEELTTEPTQQSVPTSEIKQHKAYIVGYEGKFNSDGNISRAETAAILARLTDGFNESESYTTGFADIDSTLWYAKYIGFEESKNIINGYLDGTFKPEESITRAEFASMITRFANLDTENSVIPFTDISGHWAAEQIKACYSAGYIKGYEDNSFLPDNPITRAEAVAIINRVLDRNDIKEFENPFSDVNQSHWAYMDIMEAAITHNAE